MKTTSNLHGRIALYWNDADETAMPSVLKNLDGDRSGEKHFYDLCSSATSIDNRPDLQRLLAQVRAKHFDAVVVTRGNQLSHSAVQAVQVIADIVRAGASFIAIEQPELTILREDPSRLAKLGLLEAGTAVEHGSRKDWIQNGLRTARARGVRLGARPKLTDQQRATARALYAAGVTQAALATQFAVSPMTMSRALRQ